MNATSNKKPKLKLSGTDGNAFTIIGRARGVARTAKMPDAQIERMVAEMTAGDYDNLLAVTSKYFDVT